MLLEAAYESIYRRWSPDLSDASEQRHRFDLQRWSALMPAKEIDQITTLDLQDFRRLSAKAGHSPSTTETTVRTVKQILNAAASMGHLDKVPYPGRGRKIVRQPPRPATAEELWRLYHIGSAAARWPKNSAFRCSRHWWRAWIGFAYWTGLRLSDLTWGLERNHIEPGAIRYTASKTGVSHVFPMRAELWQLLNLRLSEPGPIFNCYRKPSRLRMHLAHMCESAEIRRLTPKHFRQAACTQWGKVNAMAGGIIHGSSMPSVMKSYIDPLELLNSVAPQVLWPFGEVRYEQTPISPSVTSQSFLE